MGKFRKVEHFLKTFILSYLKWINAYKNKSNVRHSTDPYFDVLYKFVSSAHYEHQTL